MAVYFHYGVPGLIGRHKRSTYDSVSKVCAEQGLIRKSSLRSPVERIEDHDSEILTCEFHPFGELLMSAGLRQEIHICSVYGQTDDNIMILKGHHGAVMEAHFSMDGFNIYSCSSDETLAVWDTFTGIRISCLRGHTGCINTVQCARTGIPMLCSGSDDATVRIWDVRQQVNVLAFETRSQTTAMCFSETTEHVFTGEIKPDINIWDLRMCDVVLSLQGHTDAVSGIALSPCGTLLLSHSLDNTLRVWDIRPSFTGDRCLQIFESNQYIVNGNLLRCAWSPDGTKISAGCADDTVPIWDRIEGAMISDLPGHQCTVNDIDFHPQEPIIVSASSDEYLLLRELED